MDLEVRDKRERYCCDSSMASFSSLGKARYPAMCRGEQGMMVELYKARKRNKKWL